jgi:hypothetical protein
MLLQLIERLIMWDYFKEQLVKLIIKVGEEDYLLKINSHLLKKFLISFISKNIEQLKSEGFLVKLLQAYLIDDNPGVYEQASFLLFQLLFTENNKEDIFINIINHLDTQSKDSVILIREVELLTKYLSLYDSKAISDRLNLINVNFYDYDILTQLTIMDTYDKCVEKADLAIAVIQDLDFFYKLNTDGDLPGELIRKVLYTFSKFYAKGFIDETKTAKNILAIALQYYCDNKNENYFILSFLVNCFHNKNIFDLLNDEENNKIFNFNDAITAAIIETYYNHDPNVKMHCLELLQVVGNLELPSISQEIFLKKLLQGFYKYEFNKFADNEESLFKFFVDKIYKDLKTHDFEDYEARFLETVLSKSFYLFLDMISYEQIIKKIAMNFDFMLYLLNRRLRSQEICLLKFKIIEGISKNPSALSVADKALVEQINNYIVKGPY